MTFAGNMRTISLLQKQLTLLKFFFVLVFKNIQFSFINNNIGKKTGKKNSFFFGKFEDFYL